MFFFILRRAGLAFTLNHWIVCLPMAGTRSGSTHILSSFPVQWKLGKAAFYWLSSKPEAGSPESYFQTPAGYVRRRLDPFSFPSSSPFSVCGSCFLLPPRHLNIVCKCSSGSSGVESWFWGPYPTCQQHEQVALLLGSAHTQAWLLDSGTTQLKPRAQGSLKAHLSRIGQSRVRSCWGWKKWGLLFSPQRSHFFSNKFGWKTIPLPTALLPAGS